MRKEVEDRICKTLSDDNFFRKTNSQALSGANVVC